MTHIAPARINDPADFGRVGLVIGGDSAEREVSLTGGADIASSFRGARGLRGDSGRPDVLRWPPMGALCEGRCLPLQAQRQAHQGDQGALAL